MGQWVGLAPASLVPNLGINNLPRYQRLSDLPQHYICVTKFGSKNANRYMYIPTSLALQWAGS